LAELYMQDVRKVQPHGPYQFFGFCFGGTVAYELARRLREDGEPVSLVAMVQSVNSAEVAHSKRYKLVRFYDRSANYARQMFRGEWKEIGEKLHSLISWQKNKLKWQHPDPVAAEPSASASGGIDETIALLSMVGDAYDPKPYPGQIRLIRAANLPAELASEPTFGWQAVVRDGVDVHTLPGDHYTILEKPNVSHVAEALDEWLAKGAAVRV
jgi:thioesterase domain-containing protein